MTQIGISENFLNLTKNQTDAFLAFIKIMPERGEMISDETMYKSIHKIRDVPPEKDVLAKWYNANKAVVDKFFKYVAKKDGPAASAIIYLIMKHHLLGWCYRYKNTNKCDPAQVLKALGEETHDLLLPEFGWEYLAYEA